MYPNLLGHVEIKVPDESDAFLADTLAAMAHPVRICLLRQLREPRILKEIRVGRPDRDNPDRNRPLARQTIKEHLERLLDVGLAEAIVSGEGPTRTVRYVIAHPRVYALAESFTDMARIAPPVELDDATRIASTRSSGPPDAGPRLVFTKGPEEGRIIALGKNADDAARTWTVGRSRDADISLHYDPFASSLNCALQGSDGKWTLEDLGRSTNPPRLNDRSLDANETALLNAGDVLRIGSTSLVFQR